MQTFTKFLLMAMVVGLGESTFCSSVLAVSRSPAQILKELDEIKIPAFESDKKGDQTYTRQFLTKLQGATERRVFLILELYKADPNHDRIPMLMAERWSIRAYALTADRVLAEIDEVLAHTQNQKLRIEAIYSRTYVRLYESSADKPLDPSVVEEYLKLVPGDPRGATLLQLAARRTNDEQAKTAFEDRLLRDFPQTPIAQRLNGIRHSSDRIGKPFQLEFTDAVTGSAVSVKNLKGKIIVIDFWATWCVPCVAEMPEMKKLYAKYHGEGVEFLGVSLDHSQAQGGLDRLRKYVNEEKIAWPQYYQGNGWDSSFSSSCGIHEIPAIFVLDTEGNLYSTEAHGKLDTIIPELLEKSQKR